MDGSSFARLIPTYLFCAILLSNDAGHVDDTTSFVCSPSTDIDSRLYILSLLADIVVSSFERLRLEQIATFVLRSEIGCESAKRVRVPCVMGFLLGRR